MNLRACCNKEERDDEVYHMCIECQEESCNDCMRGLCQHCLHNFCKDCFTDNNIICNRCIIQPISHVERVNEILLIIRAQISLQADLILLDKALFDKVKLPINGLIYLPYRDISDPISFTKLKRNKIYYQVNDVPDSIYHKNTLFTHLETKNTDPMTNLPIQTIKRIKFKNHYK